MSLYQSFVFVIILTGLGVLFLFSHDYRKKGQYNQGFETMLNGTETLNFSRPVSPESTRSSRYGFI